MRKLVHGFLTSCFWIALVANYLFSFIPSSYFLEVNANSIQYVVTYLYKALEKMFYEIYS
uniref:Uncharacterized protein n=1 Tax=Setaria viridis TaxID=4556 RepID=A0A4U6WDS2_SETVI|nr:hypothetical protein SEVIR_1G274950v2 [Setaria viridis]